MPTIQIRYGHTPVPFDYDETRFQILGNEIESRPLSDAEIGEAFVRMDSDRDGELSLEEFMKGLARPFGSQREGVVYQKLPARFRVLDADNSGFLDAKEYAGLAPRWQGRGEAPSFEAADYDKDSRIDFREFAREHAPREDADAAPPEATAAATEPATRR